MKRFLQVCAMAGVTLLFGQTASGEIVFSNYADADTNQYTVFRNPPGEIREDFVTAAHPYGHWQIESVLLYAYALAGTQPARLRLYADNNNAPGAVLFETYITLYTYGGGNGPIAVSDLTLDAGRQYWLGLGAVSSVTNCVWHQTLANPNDLMWVYDGQIIDGGGHVFKMDGTAIPEPATLSLLAVGLGCLLRRHRSR